MKTITHVFLSTLLLIVIVSGCTFTSTRLNSDDDKHDAEKVANKFFEQLKSKNYNATYALFSPKFWEATSKDKLNEIFTASQNKLGALINTSLGDWETKVVTGTDPSAQYQLLYKNHRQKYDSKETLTLIKDDDGKIRISYYNITSDGFFK